MTQTEITWMRLRAQHITACRFDSAAGLVACMGAMQAQDYPMAKWALGLRLPGSTDASVESAIDRGELIRTHVMRPTWHLVAAADLRWMTELTATQIRNAMRTRHKQLEITDGVLSQAYAVLEALMRGGRSAVREEINAAFEQAGIAIGDNRNSHLLVCAELDGLICSGASRNGKPAYALVRERVAPTPARSREDALKTLASRYFTSHGPATLQDFIWWAGLPVADARRALEMVRPGLESATTGGSTYWFDGSAVPSEFGKSDVYLLPAFDEYLISYKDRSAALGLAEFPRAVSTNGIFYPIIVVNGRVAGLWKRRVKNDRVFVAFEFFTEPPAAVKKNTVRAAERFAGFLNCTKLTIE